MRFVQKVTRSHDTTVRTTCDFCGGDTDGGNGYERPEVTIEAKSGDVWPEEDCRTLWEVDACFDCFEKKIRPAIETLGVKFRKRYAGDSYAGATRLPEEPTEGAMHERALQAEKQRDQARESAQAIQKEVRRLRDRSERDNFFDRVVGECLFRAKRARLDAQAMAEGTKSRERMETVADVLDDFAAFARGVRKG